MSAYRYEPIEMCQPVLKLQHRIIYADTDAGGVVYYGNYMRLLEMGRTEFMRSMLGVPYQKLQKEGVIFPVSEVFCRYKTSAVYDDLVEIYTSLFNFTGFTIRFHYEIRRTEGGRLLVRGYTVHAAVDREGRLCRIPESLLTAMTRLEKGD
ncbi:MAG: acyl-CoA thioesterase [Dissulfurimicrobium sp.]|uniref:acyl-CoA thioesterase n=1 Tax=Dissulfurimicrobium TaxID=1769732 RepID=UPI001ED9E626|nr:thioesterase family protein [Dissulfurimicrobium hydrothermale]UKL14510.1 acyl-CoA thioesterase [Dissulfurimicrobium hydrothermale]